MVRPIIKRNKMNNKKIYKRLLTSEYNNNNSVNLQRIAKKKYIFKLNLSLSFYICYQDLYFYDICFQTFKFF